MNISLTKFCKDTGLPKSSVYRRCQELGIDTTNGLSDEAVQQLRHEFDVVHQAAPDAPAAPTIPEDFIQPSALVPVEVMEAELPDNFDPSAMVRFFDGVAGKGTDTTKLLAVAKHVLTAVESVMDSKIKQQRQALSQAESDGAELRELIGETKGNLKLKALESRLLAERQTAATIQTEKAFGELMALGKPTEQS